MLPWLSLLACHPTPPPAQVDSGAPLADCAPALTLSPQDAVTPLWGLVQVHASGGSGDYLFSLDGVGEIAESSGSFVAGGVAGSAVVTVVDSGCLGSAQVTLRVVDALALEPGQLSVTPGARVEFGYSGGAAASCSMAQSESGASVTADCVYSAGPSEGTDRVRLVDPSTGAFAESLVTVDHASSFSVWGYERVYLPQGARFSFDPVGGSGALTLEALSGDLEMQGSVLTAGAGRVRVHDRYVDTYVDVDVLRVAPIAPAAVRDGERAGLAQALSVGDVDGDGYPEVLVGMPEVSEQAYYGGLVALYRGSASGLEPTPVATWSGESRYEAVGRALASADLDGDGAPELLIGSGGIDRGATNNGGVRIYDGGGVWGSQPSQTLYGQVEYDRFGDALALCDFDADGWMDLAVGAPDSQDGTTDWQEQGSVQIFKGSADGFADKADFVLWGQLPVEDGEWQGQDGLHLGLSLAAGDLNGDGLCDVAAGGQDIVLVWAGVSERGLTLSRTPSAVLDGGSGDFGRSLAVGDVDADGVQELLVGHWGSDHGKSNGGAAHLFAGLAMDGSVMGVEDAVWTVYGTASSDYVGSSVAMKDLDGDGKSEVMIGAYRVEDDERTNSGVVLFYDGIKARTDGTVESTSRASVRLVGTNSQGRFGQAVAPVDNQGLLVVAGYDSEFGVQAGAPWYAPLDGGEHTLLELPGQASGHDFARAMLLVDLDADGTQELLFGASGAGEPEEGANAGLVYAYDYEQGTAHSPRTVLGGHHSWSSSDRYGHLFATLDFDGDGRQDLAVAARKDSKLSNLNSSYANPDQCSEYLALAGSVLIYRGRGSGYESTPTWIVHSPDSYGYIDALLGGVDLNGDGREELVFGGRGWYAGGGFGVAFGQPRDKDGTLVVCDALYYQGQDSYDRLGYSFADLGDLDGDGCEELAIGATGTELGSDYYNQGMVHLLWGWGGSCGAQQQFSELSMRTVGAGIGSALDAADVDGDGLMDLLVGGAERRAEFAELGGVWVSPGSYLKERSRHTTSQGSMPDLDELGFEYLVPGGGVEARQALLGPTAASQFGAAVAWVLLADDTWAAAVGLPQGGLGGTPLSGGVALFRYQIVDGAWGLESVPFAVLAGESAAPLGELGATLRAQQQGGESVLLVGAPLSSASGVDLGAGYVVVLE